jgi:hypothetical protein
MKANIGFSIEEEVAREFNEHCKRESINKSALGEIMIKRYLESIKRKAKA